MIHIADNLYLDAAPDFGPGPACEARLMDYIRSGIEVVVSLRSWEPLEAAYTVLQLEFHHIPIDDFETPTGDDVRRFVDLVTRNHNRKVLVHCKAGRGRSGTLAALYLKSRGMDGTEAMRLVRDVRPGAIETPEQEALVLDFVFPEPVPRARLATPPAPHPAALPLPVVAAVIVRDGRVLLACRRAGDHQGGRWEFPGGKLHPGETPAASLARELAEELDIAVAVEEPLAFVYWEYPEKRILLLFYRCRITAGEPHPVECAAVDYFPPADLETMDLAEADRAALPALLRAMAGNS
ncbi:MAG TPA: NUDIX domain-containing protein [Acidobacteriota bacterium]|nr:NUDIX domain-containing protein [Acidobacteriota bacterium]HQM64547.1 NUDIX domain-containing protein [Acidobacteriota bacterium]